MLHHLALGARCVTPDGGELLGGDRVLACAPRALEERPALEGGDGQYPLHCIARGVIARSLEEQLEQGGLGGVLGLLVAGKHPVAEPENRRVHQGEDFVEDGAVAVGEPGHELGEPEPVGFGPDSGGRGRWPRPFFG